MRSLTVPVSFSILLFPTVPPDLSLSRFLSPWPFSGLGVCEWTRDGSGSCDASWPRADEASPRVTIKIKKKKQRLISICLRIDKTGSLPRYPRLSNKQDGADSRMSGCKRICILRVRIRSALLPVNLQVQIDFLAAVKARNRTCRRLGTVFFCVHFIICIGVEPAEAISACVVRVIAPDGIRPSVFQEDNAPSDRAFGFVHHHAADGAELCFAFLILRFSGSGEERHYCYQTE